MNKLIAQWAVGGAFVLSSLASPGARAEKHQTNACGCYGELNACFCERKAKCGCPGECEPKGCEEERQKKMQKEIAEETKKVKDAEKAQQKAQEDQAQAKARDEAKSLAKDDDDDAGATAAADKGGKGNTGKAVHKMSAAQKKQLSKLIDAFMAEHPDASQETLAEIRKGL